MSATIIRFPRKGKGGARRSRQAAQDLGRIMETAIEVHDLIIRGLRARWLVTHSGGADKALALALREIYGDDHVLSAAEDFEIIYGCDPFTFVHHLLDYR